jgi:5'-phosphate synthase pdxT subunit
VHLLTVRILRKPTWGTCAGLILLAEAANRTKKGGQELIGGLDVRVNRNHFGRQTESFERDMDLKFLSDVANHTSESQEPFKGVFIRAPVVEKILEVKEGPQIEESHREDTIIAPSRAPATAAARRYVGAEIEVLATLPPRKTSLETAKADDNDHSDAGDIIAVRQGNVFGTSFHPELTGDERIHEWWLKQVKKALEEDATEMH